ncbi:MAG TPA: hypothetical protein VFW83_06105, partial [Bryobacteraceae bacterium]|nr:hypothetical protein [Bryobacteraceae bacterium]
MARLADLRLCRFFHPILQMIPAQNIASIAMLTTKTANCCPKLSESNRRHIAETRRALHRSMGRAGLSLVIVIAV